MSSNSYLDRRTANDQNDDNDADDASDTMNDDTPTPVGNETSSLYAAIDPLYYGARRAIEANPNDSTSFADRDESDMSPQERWYAALYYARKALGKRHSEAHEFSMEAYREQFGVDLPAIETGDVEDTLDLMASHGIDVDDLRGMPVIAQSGEALPVIVNDEGELTSAFSSLESAVPEEPGVAESADESADESDEGEGYFGGSNGSDDPDESDDSPEGYVAPHTLTVADLRDYVTSMDSLDAVRQMLNDERDGEKRKTAMKALQGRVNRLRGSSDTSAAADGGQPEESDDEEVPEFNGTDPDESESDEGGAVPEGLTFNLPDDASRGTRLQKAGILMDEFDVSESEAMTAVGL